MAGTRRSFSAEFKAEIVRSILTGAQTQAAVCRRHALKPELVVLWKKTLLEPLPSVFAGPDVAPADAARVSELERPVGRLTLELDVAKKASALLPSLLGNGGRS